MTMRPPSREEILAAAEELESEVLEPLEAEQLEPVELKPEHLDPEHLEVQGEPAAADADDSGTLDLEEIASPEAQETFSIRQTEPFQKFAADDETNPDEPNKQGDSDDWDFLDTRKK